MKRLQQTNPTSHLLINHLLTNPMINLRTSHPMINLLINPTNNPMKRVIHPANPMTMATIVNPIHGPILLQITMQFPNCLNLLVPLIPIPIPIRIYHLLPILNAQINVCVRKSIIYQMKNGTNSKMHLLNWQKMA
eukprot:NODE_152_length_15391_cov_0.883272.p18 type:complete len:135 gc:universal NODE_152_length_15391_cov_0.883272:15285-14881(-)